VTDQAFTDQQILACARTVLTRRQFQVWTAVDGGASHRTVAIAMGVDRGTIRSAVEAAQLKITRELDRVHAWRTGTGDWTPADIARFTTIMEGR